MGVRHMMIKPGSSENVKIQTCWQDANGNTQCSQCKSGQACPE